jgi:secreted trypsin-like serine protease
MKVALAVLAILLVGAQARPKAPKAVPVPAHLGSSNGRIINGQDAEIGQFPHVAFLLMHKQFLNYQCTASLISDEWILTAGHCVDGVVSFDVTMGAIDYTSNEAGKVTVNTETSILHENYGSTLLRNDIGLVKLASPVALSDTIKVSSVKTGSVGAGEPVVIAGWGLQSDSAAATPRTLQFNDGDVSTISNAECQQTYGATIQDTVICTTGSSSGGTCSGDSGSALNVKDASTETGFATIGVTSFVSSAGCESGYPDGFTRVSEYIDWIETNTGITLNTVA